MWRLMYIVWLVFLTGCATDNETAEVPSEMREGREEAKEPFLMEVVGEFFGLRAEEAKEVERSLYYVALGDSLTQGVGDEREQKGYTGRLQQQLAKELNVLDVQLNNQGKSGRRSDQLLALLEKEQYNEAIQKAELITMTIGGNDVMKVVRSDLFNLKEEMFEAELPHFVERYEAIMQVIRKQNADVPVVLIGFYNPFSIVTDAYTPFQTIIKNWNDEIARIAKADGRACFVPIADLFETNENMVYHTDFFHPNAAGYELMTNRIVEQMKACDMEKMSNGSITFEE